MFVTIMDVYITRLLRIILFNGQVSFHPTEYTATWMSQLSL